MNRFLVIDGDMVVNSIVAESLEIAEQVTGATCVASEEASIGWIYDFETGNFTSPITVEVAEEIIEETLAIEAPAEEPAPTE